MSTRKCYGFRLKDKDYLTYNHCDSYPSALMDSVIKFCEKVNKDQNGWQNLKEKVGELELVDEGDKASSNLIQKYKKFSNKSVSTQNLSDWYVLLRELQNGNILDYIYSGEVSHMIDNHDFIKASLHCEWAYIINLDSMKLEVYEGWQESPDENNRYGSDSKNGYFPCKMIASDKFTNLLDLITTVYKLTEE